MTRAAAILLVSLLVLAAAACGGGKKAATTTPPTVTAASPPATVTTTPPTAVLTTLASLGSCPQLAGLESSLLTALEGAGANVTDEIAAIKREAAKTPKAVRADFLTIADALAQAADNLKGVDLSKATSATVTKLMSKLSSPDVAAATTRIGNWAAQHCHG